MSTTTDRNKIAALPMESVVRDADGDWFERWAWPADDWRLFGTGRDVSHAEMVLPVTIFQEGQCR